MCALLRAATFSGDWRHRLGTSKSHADAAAARPQRNRTRSVPAYRLGQCDIQTACCAGRTGLAVFHPGSPLYRPLSVVAPPPGCATQAVPAGVRQHRIQRSEVRQAVVFVEFVAFAWARRADEPLLCGEARPCSGGFPSCALSHEAQQHRERLVSAGKSAYITYETVARSMS
jgi:hypothetical protein